LCSRPELEDVPCSFELRIKWSLALN